MIPILDIVSIGTKLIDKLIPDPEKKAQAQLDLAKLQQEGELKELENETQLMLAQAAINQEEAKSESFFKSGWRPSIGWICALGFGYLFLVHPLLSWASSMLHISLPPAPDSNVMITMLFGMLGLGGMRTMEKFKK